MKRSITGQAADQRMTLGELRRFMTSIEGIPDDVPVRVKASFRGKLRSMTVEEEDDTFAGFLESVGALGEPTTTPKAKTSK